MDKKNIKIILEKHKMFDVFSKKAVKNLYEKVFNICNDDKSTITITTNLLSLALRFGTNYDYFYERIFKYIRS